MSENSELFKKQLAEAERQGLREVLNKIKTILDHAPGDTSKPVVVDIGCGSMMSTDFSPGDGYTATFLREAHKDPRFAEGQLVGIDVGPQDPADAQVYQHIYEDITNYRLESLLKSSVQGQVDVFVCRNLLLNLSPGLEDALNTKKINYENFFLSYLKDMVRLCKEGGAVVLDRIVFVKHKDKLVPVVKSTESQADLAKLRGIFEKAGKLQVIEQIVHFEKK